VILSHCGGEAPPRVDLTHSARPRPMTGICARSKDGRQRGAFEGKWDCVTSSGSPDQRWRTPISRLARGREDMRSAPVRQLTSHPEQPKVSDYRTEASCTVVSVGLFNLGLGVHDKGTAARPAASCAGKNRSAAMAALMDPALICGCAICS
jgi:hypothetical protein